MTRIVVAGAGFAAMTAVKRLRKRMPDAEITLVAPVPEFVYLPSLIWVPFGLRDGDSLRFDITPVLTKHNIRFHQATVTGISADTRSLQTSNGNIDYDALLIATGGRFIKKLPGIKHAITLCEGIHAAETLRDRLQQLDSGTIALGFGGNPAEPAAMRGGPMFELLFGLDTWLRKQGKREKFDLVFFNPAAAPGKRLGEKAVSGLLAEMQRRGIRTRLGHRLTGFSETGVITEGGSIAADLILFMPGMTGPAWIEGTALPASPGGFIRADAQCRVEGFERVYVAGDAGSFPGPDWLPKQAHLADLQAVTAADNIASELAAKTVTQRFRPELVCIVDTLDRGILVYRDSKRAWMLPPLRFMHWAKLLFERFYLRGYRGTPVSRPVPGE